MNECFHVQSKVITKNKSNTKWQTKQMHLKVVVFFFTSYHSNITLQLASQIPVVKFQISSGWKKANPPSVSRSDKNEGNVSNR